MAVIDTHSPALEQERRMLLELIELEKQKHFGLSDLHDDPGSPPTAARFVARWQAFQSATEKLRDELIALESRAKS